MTILQSSVILWISLSNNSHHLFLPPWWLVGGLVRETRTLVIWPVLETIIHGLKLPVYAPRIIVIHHCRLLTTSGGKCSVRRPGVVDDLVVILKKKHFVYQRVYFFRLYCNTCTKFILRLHIVHFSKMFFFFLDK